MNDRNRYRAPDEQPARSDSDIRISAVLTAPNQARRQEVAPLTEAREAAILANARRAAFISRLVEAG